MLETFISQMSSNANQLGPLAVVWCQFLGVTISDWNKIEFVADSRLPLPGDIIIFDNDGGTSIFVSNIEWNSWEGFDDTSDNKTLGINQHDWSHISHWYTPKDQLVMDKRPLKPTPPPAPVRTAIAPPLAAPSKTDVVHVLFTIPKYGTMTDALNQTNSTGDLRDGQYFVYNRLNGVMNVTTQLGRSVSIWINPADLQPKPIKQSPVINWRSYYKPFRDKYGNITSKYYVAIQDDKVIDLETGRELPIAAGQPVLIGGWFTGPDGVGYARPWEAANRFLWFGVRMDNLEPEKEAEVINATPELDLTSAINVRAKIALVLQNSRKFFDIIKQKRNQQ